MQSHMGRYRRRNLPDGRRSRGDRPRLLPDGGQPRDDDEADEADEDADDPGVDADEADDPGVDGHDAAEDTDATAGPAAEDESDGADTEGTGNETASGAGRADDPDTERTAGAGDVDESNVEITDEAEPAEPRWEEPDLEEIPEFELGAEGPLTKPPDAGSGVGSSSGSGSESGTGVGSGGPQRSEDPPGGGDAADPGAGMPNTPRSPEATRISSEGTEAYVVALEICARLPDDVRLPEEAAEIVPTAVEAELEQDIQQFAAAEFGVETPHVDTFSFDEVDDDIWLRLRIGVPPSGFDRLDPEAIRSHALTELEGIL